MISRKFIPDETGITMTVEAVLLFSISIIFMGLVFLSFQGLNDRQTEIVMKEEFQARGNDIAKKMFDMNIEAMASLAAGSTTTTQTALELPSKVADNTYSVKILSGKVVLESTSGPYVKVEVPFNSDINAADNSTIYSAGGTHELQYDSRSGSIFFTDGGVIPPPDPNAPTISIISPAAGATLSNTTTIVVDVFDYEGGLTRVEYYVDGTYKYTATSNYNWSWDTRSMPDGNHNVTAIAYDTAGHSTPDTRSYFLSNGISDPPVITIFTPLPNENTNFSRPEIKFKISDDIGIDFSSIIFLVDNVNQISNATFANVSSKLTTIKYTHASGMNVSPPEHKINVSVKDTDSTIHERWESWNFTIDPIVDINIPTVSMIFPASDNDLVPGASIAVTYEAHDVGSGLDNLSIRVNDSIGTVYWRNKTISTYPTQINDIGPETATLSGTYVAGRNYTFNITVFDRAGNKATVSRKLYVALPGQSSQLEVDTTSKTLTSSNTVLGNIKLKDNTSDSLFLYITNIKVSWSPNSTQKITRVRIDGSNKWRSTGSYTPSGPQSSGTLLNFNTPYTVASTFKIMEMTFDSDMAGKNFSLIFYLSDGTTKTVTFST